MRYVYLFLILIVTKTAVALPISMHMIQSRQDNWGYIDPTGRFVPFPNQVGNLNFVNGMSRAAIHNSWGFIDKEGNVVREFKYHAIADYPNGERLLIENIEGKYKESFIDSLFNVVVPRSENMFNVTEFNEDIAVVCFYGEDQTQYGYYKQGKKLFNKQFTTAWRFEKGIAKVVVARGGGETIYRWIDTCGNKVLGDFIVANDFIKNMALIAYYDTVNLYDPDYKKRMYKWIDRTGKTLMGPYSDAIEFNCGLAAVEKIIPNKGRKRGFVNRKGELVVDYKYDDVFNFDRQGRSRVVYYTPPAKGQVQCKQNRGVIDSTGAEMISCLYESINVIGQFLSLEKNGLCALATQTGEIITPFVYDYFSEHTWNEKDNYSTLKYVKGIQKGRAFVLDSNGHLIMPPIYQDIYPVNDSKMFYVRKNNKWGVIFGNGKTFIPCQYDQYIETNQPNVLCFRKDKTWLFFDHKGNFIYQTNSNLVVVDY